MLILWTSARRSTPSHAGESIGMTAEVANLSGLDEKECPGTQRRCRMPAFGPKDMKFVEQLPPTKLGRDQNQLRQTIGRVGYVQNLRAPGQRVAHPCGHSESIQRNWPPANGHCGIAASVVSGNLTSTGFMRHNLYLLIIFNH